MTVDTAAVAENKKPNLSITKRDRRDVIRQVREITGLDENSINQTIEACKDGTGRYSLEQVISLLFDDSHIRNNLQRSAQTNPQGGNCSSNVPVGPNSDRSNGEPITDDVIELSADVEGQTTGDDDLERALQLSRETIEQTIEESDIAERTSLDQPAGLKNIGNTCWFNSVVQVLYSLPYFRQLIFNFQCANFNNSIGENEQQALLFTEELRSLFALMLKSARRSINPDRALKKFKNTRKLCGVDFSHEDCSEFAIHLIDLVELAYETIGKNFINADNNVSNSFINPVNLLVTGEVLVERNENASIREALRQINIQMNDSSNLYDGLEALWLGSADESLCLPQSIVEQRWLTRVPPVLFICLNRYRFSQKTKQTSKIVAPFEFDPEINLDRYMLINKELVLSKRDAAKKLYKKLHELESLLNSHLKYPGYDESFSLSNALRVVFEFVTSRRIDSNLSESVSSTNSIHLAQTTEAQIEFIEKNFPNWLIEVESKCQNLRAEIQQVKNELKELYNDAQLKKTRYALHGVCVHEGTVNLGHFWTYVFHSDREKWFRYNDNEVTETNWNEVFQTAIGGQTSTNDSETGRTPSAYLLMYKNLDEKSLSQNFQQNELPTELQRILDEDILLLQQQIETVKLEQLFNELKFSNEQIEKQTTPHKVLSLPFFSGVNPASDSELIKPVMESTLRLMKSFSSRILSVPVAHLVQEMVEREIKNYSYTANMITSGLPFHDLRLQHILNYFSVNRIDNVYRQRAMFDILRLTPVPNEEIRLKILKLQAQLMAHDFQMSNDEIQEYQRCLIEYKDFRSIIAAFLAGFSLMNEEKFEEAITYYCVACEYNLRLSKQCTLPMRAMDSCLLFKARRLCFERWNDLVMNQFKNDPEYRLDGMTHHFLPCLMQLKVSSEDDQAYIHEVQRIWFLLLDKLEPTERSSSLDEFLQRLLEQPISQHYHSVSINKHQLIERYEEAVRELQQRYPTFFGNAPEQLTSSVRSLNSNDPRASSPMQQDDDQQDAPTHP